MLRIVSTFLHRNFDVMQSLLAKLLGLLFLLVGISCEDIPDCPNKLCVLAGGWQLVEVYIDGVRDTSTDLSKYRLTLLTPSPTTATTSDFNRTNPSGRQDTGTWQVLNKDTILALIPDSSPEEQYIIKSLSPRELRLVIDRDVNKTGPDQYEYVLEPF